jgi:enoyl-CoA hydratase/carnithine racemase
MNDTVLITLEGPIAWITLNRPERLNAMNRPLVDGLIAALSAAEANDDIRAVILNGAGRAFCSGDDLKDLDAQTASKAETEDWVEAIQAVTLHVMRSRKIVIAAVHGWCVGGALEWAINCDSGSLPRTPAGSSPRSATACS